MLLQYETSFTSEQIDSSAGNAGRCLEHAGREPRHIPATTGRAATNCI